MKLIRGQHNLAQEHRGCVATIGNFDGVHLGHQAVFSELARKAAEHDVPATVIIFEPQPLEFFQPDYAPARLTRLREKLQALADAGVQRVLLLEFNRQLAEMHAEEFIQRILLDKLGIRHLFVGDDFRFGKNRTGDFSLLREQGMKHGFGVEDMNTVCHDNCRISSTRIRMLLAEGRLDSASAMLGRPYTICGRVVHGDKRGRSIGFPTMNVNLHRVVSPLHGVFAVRVAGLDEQPLPGVANVGTRPSVEGDPRYLLEVHVFHFDRSVYGEHVAVEFVERIREERKFNSFDELRHQISLDTDRAREILELSQYEMPSLNL